MNNCKVLEVQGISRRFDKDAVFAVNNLSFSLKPGEILGFLGPNGAGKTTTIKMLSTLLAPTSGKIIIDGTDALTSAREARAKIGIHLGGDFGFYTRASVLDNLMFFGAIAGVKYRNLTARAREVIALVGLEEKTGAKVETLSRGMKQRLHLARAMIGQPKVLLLDEPSSGLDPLIAGEIRSLITKLAKQGTAIVLSTHHMIEAQEVADQLLVINRGKTLAYGDISTILRGSGGELVTTWTMGPRQYELVAEKLENISTLQTDTSASNPSIALKVFWPNTEEQGAKEPLIKTVLQEANRELPADYITRPVTLEEAYLQLVREASL